MPGFATIKLLKITKGARKCPNHGHEENSKRIPELGKEDFGQYMKLAFLGGEIISTKIPRVPVWLIISRTTGYQTDIHIFFIIFMLYI